MRKRSLIAVALGVSVVIAFGGLYASNMGFKLNKELVKNGGPVNGGTSFSGQSEFALPYNPQTSITDAAGLHADMELVNGAGSVFSVSRFTRSADGFDTYVPGPGALNFPITGSEGLRVQIEDTQPTLNYIIVGSHDPGRVITLLPSGAPVPAPEGGTSASGFTLFPFPYHGTAASASDIYDEVEAAGGPGSVFSISKFQPENSDGYTAYVPGPGADDFATAPGDSYRIQLAVGAPTVNYVPSHY